MSHKRTDITNIVSNCFYNVESETLGLLQTEHSGIGFNPFVNASHTDAERHYFGKDHPFPCESRSLSHGNTRASLHCGPRSRITFTLKSPSGLFKVSYLGSVRAVTNQWGSPLRTFDYDVFGQPLQDRPERFHYGYTGKEYDNWTGLYNYGFRDYASLYGRFTTVDPIQDGHNWYAYAVSDPVNWLDPWGLDCPPDTKSGEDSERYIDVDGKATPSNLQYLVNAAFNNFVTNAIPAMWQDFKGKVGNFFSNIFSGKGGVQISGTASFASISGKLTVYECNTTQKSKTLTIKGFDEEAFAETLTSVANCPVTITSKKISVSVDVVSLVISKDENGITIASVGLGMPLPPGISAGFEVVFSASTTEGKYGTIENRQDVELNRRGNNYVKGVEIIEQALLDMYMDEDF